MLALLREKRMMARAKALGREGEYREVKLKGDRDVFAAEVQARREAEKKAVIEKYKPTAAGGGGFKGKLKAAAKEYGKYRKSQGLGRHSSMGIQKTGGTGGGPQFGLSRDPLDDRKKKKGPNFGL